MDISQIIELISGVGFPVAVCIALFYFLNKSNEKHQQEIKQLTETINSNTQVLTELSTLIKTLVK